MARWVNRECVWRQTCCTLCVGHGASRTHYQDYEAPARSHGRAFWERCAVKSSGQAGRLLLPSLRAAICHEYSTRGAESEQTTMAKLPAGSSCKLADPPASPTHPRATKKTTSLLRNERPQTQPNRSTTAKNRAPSFSAHTLASTPTRARNP